MFEKNSQRRPNVKARLLAGGVAFNCVANGKIFDATPFEKKSTFIPPPATRASPSAPPIHLAPGSRQPRSFTMNHAYWGPGYSPEEFRAAVAASNAVSQGGFTIAELPKRELLRRTAAIIADGKSSAGIKAAPNGARAPRQSQHPSPILAARK